MSESKTYKVEYDPDHRSHYIRGLKPEWSRNEGEQDSILIHYYDGGDIDTRMRDKKMMHRALYDLFQCNEKLQQGDRFETEFGNFLCEGVHVIEERKNET